MTAPPQAYSDTRTLLGRLRAARAHREFPLGLWREVVAELGQEAAVDVWCRAGNRWRFNDGRQQRLAMPNLKQMLELGQAGREALPALYHRPAFGGVQSPGQWVCSVCWGTEGDPDGYYEQQWPCRPARLRGDDIARHLGLVAAGQHTWGN